MLKRICIILSLIVALGHLVRGPVLAADNFVKSLKLSLQPRTPIAVTIGDDANGDPIDRTTTQDIAFDAAIAIDLAWPGALTEFAIHWGSCVGKDACTRIPVMFVEYPSARDLRTARTFSFPVERMHFGGGLALDNPRSPLFTACRDRQEPRIVHRAFVTLAVRTDRDLGKLNPNEPSPKTPKDLSEYSKTKTFPVDLAIECTFLSNISAPPQPRSVDIRVKQIGETCPRQVEVSAFIDYEKKTEARFHFLHNANPSEEIVIQPRKVTLGNKSWWRVERLQRYKVNPGQHHFRIAVADGPKSRVETIKIDCGPFRVDSVWLSYKVENGSACPKRVVERVNFTANRPGKINYEIKHEGGLVVHTGTVRAKRDGDRYTAIAKRTFETGEFNAQMMAQLKNDHARNSGWTQLQVECLNVLGGKITMRDKGTHCPRNAGIGISLRADRSGKIPYQVDCTGGRGWKRTATAQQTGANTFIAAAVLPLDIEKKEPINCALKTRFKGKLKIVDLRGRNYSCFKPAVETGAMDLVNPPKPTHGENTQPPKIVADPPRIRCIGGKVRGRRCVCSRTQRRVKFSARAWRCVKKPVRIVCKGGKVRGQRCLCSARTKKVLIGRNAWQCKKKTTRVRCIGGNARGRRCVCPRRMTAKRVGASAFRCVRKPSAKRGCPRGKVRVRGRCIRPAG